MEIDLEIGVITDTLSDIKDYVLSLKEQRDLLNSSVSKLTIENTALKTGITTRDEAIATKDATIATLQARIKELEGSGGTGATGATGGTGSTGSTGSTGGTSPSDGLWVKSAETGPRTTPTKTYTGPMKITTAKTVLDGFIIKDSLEIAADDVTITNCLFKFAGNNTRAIWQNDNGGKRAVIRYCEINGAGSKSMIGIALQDDATIEYNDIQGVVIGIQQWGTNHKIRFNWIHNLQTTATTAAERHFDGIQNLGASGFVYEGNVIELLPSDGGTASIFVSGQQGTINGGQIINNLLMGEPAYQLYIEKSSRGVSNVSTDSNYIEKGIYGQFANEQNAPNDKNNVFWNDKEPSSVPAKVKAWRAKA